MSYCGKPIFGVNKYIKLNKTNFIAVENAKILDTLNLSDVRIPYEQVLKGRVNLKKGQKNYHLNYLGMSDNVTFLAIKATYSDRADEEDNYISYQTYDNNSNSIFSQFMVLTGNSKKRIPELFLSNPNENYKVSLDIMIAVIDDNNDFYEFSDLEPTDIEYYSFYEWKDIPDNDPYFYLEYNKDILIPFNSDYLTNNFIEMKSNGHFLLKPGNYYIETNLHFENFDTNKMLSIMLFEYNNDLEEYFFIKTFYKKRENKVPTYDLMFNSSTIIKNEKETQYVIKINIISEEIESGMSGSGLSESGLSESGMLESGMSESGLSESGLSEPGLSESGMSESGLSGSGLSESMIDLPFPSDKENSPSYIIIKRINDK